MTRSRILVAMLAALILLASLLLIPRRDEHLTMLSRDGRYDEASALIAAMRRQGDARPELLTQQMLIHMKQGEVPRALDASSAYLAARPDDPAALEVHADLLLLMGRAKEHLAVSERLVRIRPEPERISQLLAKLKHAGHFAEERALLQHFAGSRMLQLKHYERLGALLSASGDWNGAARWLRYVDRHAPAGEARARLSLLYVLLQSGHVAEANERALRWLGAWRDAYLSGRLISMLAQHGGAPASVPLVSHFVEIMPGSVMEVAGVLTNAGQIEISRILLAEWIDRTPSPTARESRDYVHASLAADEHRRPLQKLLALLRDGGAQEVIAAFVEEIAHAYGAKTIAHLIPHLPGRILQQRPLLAADLALAAGNSQLARWYLEKVEIARLSDEQQDRWLELMRHAVPASAALERLLVLLERGLLPERFVPVAAEQARAAGRPALHDAIWASLRR